MNDRQINIVPGSLCLTGLLIDALGYFHVVGYHLKTFFGPTFVHMKWNSAQSVQAFTADGSTPLAGLGNYHIGWNAEMIICSRVENTPL